ncbi:hypothetical protein F5876DRAFT_69239 [Lentinula aff. lateritia]|uniref:Uncharacterized protein n=1 Tax=Lentinula aff. lateritia TaxID=2804960 RepID=A0ACC1TMX9_9AGAR|nr:hypothetical protein F5876DRAFT_69239 [Lentinula aff. lateritia]
MPPAAIIPVSATSTPGNIPAESMTYGSEFSSISVLQHQTSQGFGNIHTRANPLAGFRITSVLKPPAPTSMMAPPKPKLTKVKKTDELMVADATSDTPRNLFALEYGKTHACTRAEFGGAWKALGDAGQKPWVLLSRKMRKDGKAKAIDVGVREAKVKNDKFLVNFSGN